MWELDHKGGWTLKNWCFQTVVLEKTLESPLASKEIQPVSPKGNQSRIFNGRTDAEAEAPILWPPDVKNSLEKTRILGKIEGRRRRGQKKMRWLDGLTQWTWVWASCGSWWLTGKPGVCCSPWECKELDSTERLNWTELNWAYSPLSQTSLKII